MRLSKAILSAFAGLCIGHQAYAADIIYDGEFNFIKAQHEKEWQEQDQRIDAKLAEI